MPAPDALDDVFDTHVLIAGGGPVGLTAAIELARRGIACRVVDPLLEPPQYAKAVGVQPRTLEVFETMGVLQPVLDAAVQLRGQVVYVNGAKVDELALTLPPEVPFGFIDIPQYETERVLRDELGHHGVAVERGVALTGFTQDDDGVSATLSDGQGVRSLFLIGADGAHSVVRKTLGLTFEGAAFEERYMLGDVEVDWSQPPGWAIRAMHHTDGATDDLLVCIPLPGRGRYRMSMLVPPELEPEPVAAGDGVAHGFEGERRPGLDDIQAVLDRLSPEPTTARNLRWSSVFRISHRIVDAYGRGRVFVAGDAAHIHPPTGAQGMNTGIQDAHNLAWKLALAVRGLAADGLLDSYDAERRPVGNEVVGRTVRSAKSGIGSDSSDPNYILLREAQLLISYADSPIVGPDAGGRAPDARGLMRAAVTDPLRLFSLFGRGHTVLCYAGAEATAATLTAVQTAADAVVRATHGGAAVYLVTAPGVDTSTTLPVLIDAEGDFARSYDLAPSTAVGVWVIRPDGYLGYRAIGGVGVGPLTAHLAATFA